MIHATLDATTAISCSISPSRLNTPPRRFGSSNGFRSIAAATALLAHIPAGLAGTPPWTIHAIPETGTPGVTTPYDVSDSGYVVGLTNGGAFRYHIPTAAIDRLEWPGALEYTIPAVNNAGVVAISVRTASGWQGYRWDGQWHAVNPGLPLPPFSGVGTQSKAIDINDLGEIAGEARFEGQDPVGYMWDQAGVGHQLFWWPGYDGESMSFPGNRGGSTYTINNNHIVTGNSGWWLGSISWIGSQTVQKDSLFSQVPTRLNDANLGTIGKSLVQVRGTPSGYAIDTLGTYNTGALAYAGSVAANRLALAAPCGGVACNTGAVLAGFRYSVPLASMLANPAGWDIDVWRYGSPPANTSKISNNGQYIVGGGYLNGQYTAYYTITSGPLSFIPSTLAIPGAPYGSSTSFGAEVFGTFGPLTYQWLKDGAPLDNVRWSGAETDTVSATCLRGSDSGRYTLRSADRVGNQIESPFRLHVRPAAKQWRITSTLSGYFSLVQSLAVDGENNIIVGGYFATAGANAVKNIAKWDGTQWRTLGLGLDGNVNAVLVLPNGVIIAGGAFAQSGTTAVNNIAQWDGQRWQPMGAGLNSYVYTVAVTANGNVVAGGNFTSAGGASANHIAQWNGTHWTEIGGGANGPVGRLAVLPNGDVIAAGKFTQVGSIAATNIARWDGAAWYPLGDGLNDDVYALAVTASGALVAGGAFTASGAMPLNRIAGWDGEKWIPYGGGMNYDVGALAAMPNGMIVAGGNFTYADGSPANGTAVWNGDVWCPLDSLEAPSPSSSAMVVTSTGELLTAGSQQITFGQMLAFVQGGWIGLDLAVGKAPSPQVVEDGATIELQAQPNPGFSELTSGVSYQWFRNGIPLTAGSGGASPGGGLVTGSDGILHATQKVQLVISNATATDAGNYKVVFSTQCESASSEDVLVTVQSVCPSDLNGDGMVDDADFPVFVIAYNILDCAASEMPSGCPADINADRFVDDADFVAFVAAYNALLCP